MHRRLVRSLPWRAPCSALAGPRPTAVASPAYFTTTMARRNDRGATFGPPVRISDELKLIVDLMYEGGLAGMRYSVSETAEYGDYVSGPVVIDADTKERMRGILGRIQSGEFARDFILENQANQASFKAMRRRNAEHQIEKVGQELRGMMSWLES